MTAPLEWLLRDAVEAHEAATTNKARAKAEAEMKKALALVVKATRLGAKEVLP